MTMMMTMIMIQNVEAARVLVRKVMKEKTLRELHCKCKESSKNSRLAVFVRVAREKEHKQFVSKPKTLKNHKANELHVV